jgi:hypothetical protein
MRIQHFRKIHLGSETNGKVGVGSGKKIIPDLKHWFTQSPARFQTSFSQSKANRVVENQYLKMDKKKH